MYIAIANAIYSSTLQGSGGGFPKACFGLDYNAITSDFTFTRNSFATRVNEFGLIETVTNLGSDLVRNGSFDELGLERVVNGDFSDGENDWNFGGDWTLVNGTAEIQSSTQSYLRSDNDRVPLTVKTYKLQYEVVTTNGSNLRLAGGSSAFGTITLDSATVGVKTVYLTSNGTQAYLQINQNAFRGSIDNISLKQLDPNDDWDLGSNWSIENNIATADGTQGYLTQAGTPPIGTSGTYKFEWTQEITSGTRFRIFPRNGNDSSQSGVTIVSGSTTGSGSFNTGGNCVGSGTFTAYIETTNGFSVKFLAESGNEGTIDNVSVVEVIEDDIPRIDYTGSTFDVPVYGDELLTDGIISNGGGGSFTFTSNGVSGVSDGTSGSTLRPRLLWSSLTIGKQYRIVGTPTINSGNTNYSLYDGASYVKNQVAAEGFDLTFTCNGASVFFTNDGTQTFNIDWDLSIKELTAYTTTDKGAFLLEPISTNSIDYSGFQGGSGWTILGSSGAFVSGVAPDGDTSVYEITSTGQGKLQKGISGLAINTEYTFSFYAKQTSATTFVQSRILSQTGGSGGSNLTQVNYQDQLITDEWVRITHTFTTNDTLGNYIIYVSNALTSGESLQFFGAQVEALSYATSYIPTSGTTVTRAQESCLDGTVVANSDEGVLYWEGSSPADSTVIMAELSQGNITNRVSLVYQNASVARGAIRVNNVQTNVNGVGNLDITKKIAVVWGNNVVDFWSNGVKTDTDTYVGTIPEGVLTALNFAQVGGALDFIGRTKDLRVYCKALTDDELTQLTTLPPPEPLLDEYPNASAAYSLRELSAAMEGNAVVRVRRSNDNTEQDFTSSEITDGTLTTFTGANNGFVTTWYDQSGNSNNATQATAINQPLVVINGVLQEENGKPTIYADGSVAYSLKLSSFNVGNIPQPATFFLAYNGVMSNDYSFDGFGGSNRMADIGTFLFAGSTLNKNFPVGNIQRLATYLFNTTSSETYQNSLLTSTGNVGTSSLGGLTLFNRYNPNTNNVLVGNMQEFIIYPSNESANRLGIESNINSHYNIY